jgi:hypothetical protein
MAEGLVFKVEFDCSLSTSHFDESKENLNRSFRDGLQGVRLAEFYFIAV